MARPLALAALSFANEAEALTMLTGVPQVEWQGMVVLFATEPEVSDHASRTSILGAFYVVWPNGMSVWRPGAMVIVVTTGWSSTGKVALDKRAADDQGRRSRDGMAPLRS